MEIFIVIEISNSELVVFMDIATCEEAVRKRGQPAIDVLWTVWSALHKSSKSGVFSDRGKNIIDEIFWRFLVTNIRRNLKLKHLLNKKQVDELLIDMNIDSIISSVSYEMYERDLTELLDFLEKNTPNKELNPDDLEKLVYGYVVCLEYLLESYNIKKDDSGVFYRVWYAGNYDLEKIEKGFIEAFNSEILNSLKIPERVRIKKGSRSIFISETYWTIPYSRILDLAVRYVGYWTFRLSSSKNPSIYLFIPRKMWSKIEKIIDDKTVNNIRDKIHEGMRVLDDRKRVAFIRNILGEEDEIEEPSFKHGEIVNLIVKNPELIEEGLRILNVEYPTHAGNIDILAEDKNGNLVVIEVKTDIASHDAVGQVLKYMAWISENKISEQGGIRGIIVAKDFDAGAKYSAKGSLYKIEFIRLTQLLDSLYI